MNKKQGRPPKIHSSAPQAISTVLSDQDAIKVLLEAGYTIKNPKHIEKMKQLVHFMREEDNKRWKKYMQHIWYGGLSLDQVEF